MAKSTIECETMDELLRAITGPGNNSGRTVKEWAAILGVAESTMYAKGKETQDFRAPFTLRDLQAIIALGYIQPLEYLANLCGCVVVPLPKPGRAEAALDVEAAEASIDCGEAIKAHFESRSQASPGGSQITTVEVSHILTKVDKAVSAIVAYREHLTMSRPVMPRPFER